MESNRNNNNKTNNNNNNNNNSTILISKSTLIKPILTTSTTPLAPTTNTTTTNTTQYNTITATTTTTGEEVNNEASKNELKFEEEEEMNEIKERITWLNEIDKTGLIKLDQIVQFYFSKATSIITQSRLTSISSNLPITTTTTTNTTNTSNQTINNNNNNNNSNRLSRNNSLNFSSSSTNGIINKKTSKWFNLELEDSTELYKNELKIWKSISNLLFNSSSSSSTTTTNTNTSTSTSTSKIPEMIIEIKLNTNQLSTNQVLVLATPPLSTTSTTSTTSNPTSPVTQGKKIKVESKPSIPSTTTNSSNPSSSTKPNVILERWKISFLPHLPSSSSTSIPPINPTTSTTSSSTENQLISPSLPQLYKSTIIQFRSLFTLIHFLPSWNLFKFISPPPPSSPTPTTTTSTSTRTGSTTTTMRRSSSNVFGLSIDSRMTVDYGGETVERKEREGEIDVDTPITEAEITEGGNEEKDSRKEKAQEKVTETVKLEKVWTPFGYLQIECTYRLNVDFSVEDIETLLSSRFIDEDFFKPTMARYQSQNQAESLPSSAIPFLPPSSLSTTKPINYTRPSYGSLPSRNLIPPPPQQTTISTSPNIDINRSIPIRPTLVSSPSAPVPVRAESLSSGGRGAGGNRYGSYGASGGIEPAFVTLSRARAASNVGFISGGSGSGIQRASGLSSSPSSYPHNRRPSFSSSMSSSPIFRAGSYISPNPSTSIPTSSSLTTSSGPTSNLNRLSIGVRSPLSPFPPNSISGISSAAPNVRPSIPSFSSSPSGNHARLYSTGSYTGGTSSGIGMGFPQSRNSDSNPTSTTFSPPSQDESDDINSFLSMLDSRPSLRKKSSTGASGMLSGGNGGGGSTIWNKNTADETLKALAGSVYSTSNPSTFNMEGGNSSPRLGGMGLLQRRPSRLSIEEEPISRNSLPLPSTSYERNPPRIYRRPFDISTTTSTSSETSLTLASRTPEPYFISSAHRSTTSSPIPTSSMNFNSNRYTSRPPTVTTGFDLRPNAGTLSTIAPSPVTTESSTTSLNTNLYESSVNNDNNRFSYSGEEEAVGKLDLSAEESMLEGTKGGIGGGVGEDELDIIRSGNSSPNHLLGGVRGRRNWSDEYGLLGGTGRVGTDRDLTPGGYHHPLVDRYKRGSN